MCTPIFFLAGRDENWKELSAGFTGRQKRHYCFALRLYGSGSKFFFTALTGRARGQGCRYTYIYIYILCQEGPELIPDEDDEDEEQVSCQQHLQPENEENEGLEEEITVKEEPMDEQVVKEEPIDDSGEQDPNLEWNDADGLYDDGTTLGRAERKAKEDCFSLHGQNILNHNFTQKDLGPFQSHLFF